MEAKRRNNDLSKQEQENQISISTVRGSGYTYDEAAHPTDESIPKEEVEGEPIVKLPDLGEPGTM